MKQVAVLTALLAVALVGSYLTWTGDTEGDADTDAAVLVYVATERDLEQIRWKSDTLDVSVERRTDDAGDYVWVSATETKEVEVAPEPTEDPADAKPDEGEENGEAPEEPTDAEPADAAEGDDAEDVVAKDGPETMTETTSTAFRGNKASDDLWANFAPLEALRELTDAPGVDPTIFGFDEPVATVEIKRRSGVITLIIGAETYGSKDKYVKLDDRVFLVDDAVLRPLQFAKTRMVERRLHPLSEKDTDKVTVVAGARPASFIQQNADDRAKAYWAAESTPDEEHESAGLWLGKVFRMRASGYIASEDVDGELEPLFDVTLVDGEDSWTIKLLKSAGGDEASSDYYAQSSFNRSLVKMTRSLASEAASDVETLFGD